MIHIIENDPAAIYENLARYAFDVDSWGGPDNIASSTYYNTLFTNYGKINVSEIYRLIDLIYTRLNKTGRDLVLNYRINIEMEIDEEKFNNIVLNLIEIINEHEN